jgi:hypothetical protein
MRSAIFVLVLMVAATAAWGERVEVVWEQRFDVEALDESEWQLVGAAELREGALWTTSAPEKPIFNGVQRLREEHIPRPRDGYFLRLEWALVPVKIGGWGQDLHLAEGPVVVEFTGTRPTLNARQQAKDTVVEGKKVVQSCDFNAKRVFDWRINGKPQINVPVGPWHTGAQAASINLCDWQESKSETRWLWVRLSRVYPDDPLPLLLTGWDDVREIRQGGTSSFLVGQAGPMTKVFREATDFSGSFDPHVRIAAAGRERESFQLVVVPMGRPMRAVRAEVSDLLHEDGRTRLPSDRVTWHPVRYVQTKQSNSSIRRVGWSWPDVLMPAKPFKADAGFVTPVWFTVDVPAGAEPGVYRGIITIRPGNGPPQTVGLELTVRPFSLPLRGRLKTAFSICPGMWEIWHEPDEVKRRLGLSDDHSHGPLYTSYECEDVLPHEKWLEMYDLLLAHRLSPTTIYSMLKEGRARVVPSREDMEYCYERGMNATCLVYVEELPDDPEAAEKELSQLEAWLADWNEFIEEKNWPDMTWYVHGFDESDMRRDHAETVDPSIRRVYGMVGEKFPRIKRESANPLNPAHVGYFDIWTPLSAQWQPELRERQAAGDEVWAYVCCAPGKPYANLFVDFPGVDPRILPWQYYQHGVTGFLYYLINHYEKQEKWNMPGPKWPERPELPGMPERPWNTLSYGTNNDGILIYPGLDATPLASTRLENLRDGIEDYEALAMLADLAERLEAAGGREGLVAQAREVLAVRPEVTASWTEYTQEPEVIVGARAEVDALIEAALRALGELE